MSKSVPNDRSAFTNGNGSAGHVTTLNGGIALAVPGSDDGDPGCSGDSYS